MCVINSLCGMVEFNNSNHGLHGWTRINIFVGTGPCLCPLGASVRNCLLELSALSVLSEAGERKNKTAEWKRDGLFSIMNKVVTVHKGGNS
jgi:hypothetical protein